MSELQQPRCADLSLVGFDAQKAAGETWDAMLSAGVFVEGNFTFASGMHATLKADAEQLYANPQQLEVILGHFAAFPCIQDANVLLYVPNGMRRFVRLLGAELDKPIAETMRSPNATSKYDFMFQSPEEKELALSAEKLVICEDIVTTLGSVASMRSLLGSEQSIHSLAMLLRGTVNPLYQANLVDHYLLEREISTDKFEFRRQLEGT